VSAQCVVDRNVVAQWLLGADSGSAELCLIFDTCAVINLAPSLSLSERSESAGTIVFVVAIDVRTCHGSRAEVPYLIPHLREAAQRRAWIGQD
jgi:hypothetical protein